MSFSLTQFQNNPVNQLAALDNNFVTQGAAVQMVCGIAGTNTLALTQNASSTVVPSIPITSYAGGMTFIGVAAATNTGPVTAQVGSLPALKVFKDTIAGPVLLTGGEIVALGLISLVYVGILDSGAGGFYLISATQNVGSPITPSSVQINGGSTLTNWLSGNSPTLTFTATPGWSSQDQTFTLTGLPPSVPAPGDFVEICPPSLAANGVVYRGMVTAIGSLSSVASVATVNVRLLNSASASLASNSGIYRYSIYRAVP